MKSDNAVVAIIFSKDRAMQLDACLRSFALDCKDMDQCRQRVIYASSNERSESQYEILRRSHSGVEFIKEKSFRSDLVQAIEGFSHVLFLVDDNLFVREWSLREVLDALRNNEQAIGFSLRLGKNTSFCYTLNAVQAFPEFQKVTANILKFCWTTAEHDFGYPLEISSSIYRTQHVLPLITAATTSTNPNALEEYLSANKEAYRKTLPDLLCFATSVAFCNPTNIVQVDWLNRCSNDFGASVQALMHKFDLGYRIDLRPFVDFVSNACHQEVEISFLAPSIPWTSMIATARLESSQIQVNESNTTDGKRVLSASCQINIEALTDEEREHVLKMVHALTRSSDEDIRSKWLLRVLQDFDEQRRIELASASQMVSALREKIAHFDYITQTEIVRLNRILEQEYQLRQSWFEPELRRLQLEIEKTTHELTQTTNELTRTTIELNQIRNQRIVQLYERYKSIRRKAKRLKQMVYRRDFQEIAISAQRNLGKLSIRSASKKRVSLEGFFARMVFVFPLCRRLLRTGFMNRCWYGGRAIRTSYIGELLMKSWLREPMMEFCDYIDRRDTGTILELLRAAPEEENPSRSEKRRLGGAPTGIISKIAPLADLELHLDSIPIPSGVHATAAEQSFSIVTPFYQHLDYFKECARSVASLIREARNIAVEWVIVNDDPGITTDELVKALGNCDRSKVRLMSDGKNLGITSRLNQAIEMASYDWILLLDCDDLIEPNAIRVLQSYMRQFPKCRYISSCVVDIDEKGRLLRYRRRMEGPSALLRNGMIAGHLMAIRKDLFRDIGRLDEAFNGCQDFEFALRTAFNEPILFIPNYLYYYRWHKSSQSVSLAERQSAIAGRIGRKYSDHFLRLKHSGTRNSSSMALANDRFLLLSNRDRSPQLLLSCADARGKGIGIIRTQGVRIEMLREAVESVISQDVDTDALIVVHGDMVAHDLVAQSLIEFGNKVKVIHAPDVDRCRGYPLNVALGSLFEGTKLYHFLFFLDDDDIVYPLFSRVMAEALNVSQADVVYATSNRRIPWRTVEKGYGLLPPSCLIAGNFIPINAYCIRFSSLTRTRCIFSETLQYLEDWDFLVQLFGEGMRFFPLLDTLSEFRITGDGNTVIKRNPSEWTRCDSEVRNRIEVVCHRLGRWYLFNQINYPELLERPLTEHEEYLLKQTVEWIERYCPRAMSEMKADPVEACPMVGGLKQ